MKTKLTVLVAIINMFFIVGCGGKEYDFEGKILEIVDSTTIRVGEATGDPTATYPAYDIKIDEKTIISGEAETVSDLKVDQGVKISIEGHGEISQLGGDIVATEIIVE